MLELRGELDLSLESIETDSGSQLRRQDFNHDLATERVFFRDKYSRHTATAELALDCVGGSKCLLKLLEKICHWRSVQFIADLNSGLSRMESKNGTRKKRASPKGPLKKRPAHAIAESF